MSNHKLFDITHDYKDNDSDDTFSDEEDQHQLP